VNEERRSTRSKERRRTGGLLSIIQEGSDPANSQVKDPFNADPDPKLFTLMQIRIQLMFKVMACGYWSRDPPVLHFELPSLHCEFLRPSTLSL
jgi:hypothetical protein